jgi:hypothetical protein
MHGEDTVFRFEAAVYVADRITAETFGNPVEEFLQICVVSYSFGTVELLAQFRNTDGEQLFLQCVAVEERVK